MKARYYNNKKHFVLALFHLLIFNTMQASLPIHKEASKEEERLFQVKLEENKDSSVPTELQNKPNSFLKKVNSFFKNVVSYTRKFFWDNFHTVEKEKCYRSKQLTPTRLKKYLDKYEIKTILNLRGTKEDKSWWTQEQEVAKQNNIKVINIRLSADELPCKKDILNILDVFDKTDKPILIHCRRGADRTGMICALWVLYKMGKNKKYAKTQLSLWYGHYRYITPNMVKFIDMWEGREWLMDCYNN